MASPPASAQPPRQMHIMKHRFENYHMPWAMSLADVDGIIAKTEQAGHLFGRLFPRAWQLADQGRHPSPLHCAVAELHAAREETPGIAAMLGLEWLPDDHLSVASDGRPQFWPRFTDAPIILTGPSGSGKTRALARHFARSFIAPAAINWPASLGVPADEFHSRDYWTTGRRMLEALATAEKAGTLTEAVDAYTEQSWLYLDACEGLTVPAKLAGAFVEVLEGKLNGDNPAGLAIATTLTSAQFAAQFGKMAGKIASRLPRFFCVNFSDLLTNDVIAGHPDWCPVLDQFENQTRLPAQSAEEAP